MKSFETPSSCRLVWCNRLSISDTSLFSIPAAMVMRSRGYKSGLVAGLLLYATGTFLFLPAAAAPAIIMFLIALFVIASGLGFLETGANPLDRADWAAPRSAVRRLNFSQAFNPHRIDCGVLIGTLFIFSGSRTQRRRDCKAEAGGDLRCLPAPGDDANRSSLYLARGCGCDMGGTHRIYPVSRHCRSTRLQLTEPRGSYRELLAIRIFFSRLSRNSAM